jgi:hypothetical protein
MPPFWRAMFADTMMVPLPLFVRLMKPSSEKIGEPGLSVIHFAVSAKLKRRRLWASASSMVPTREPSMMPGRISPLASRGN